MTAKKEMSLLPEAENPNSLSSRALKWATTTGRFIVILTEIIVIAAFVSRFWFDRKNSDLSEVIRQQQAILTSTQEFENDFLTLQRQLKTIKEFYANQPDYINNINTLVESTPNDVVFENLLITKKDDNKEVAATVNLTAYREESVVDFITNLILNPNIKTVDINIIEKKPKENKYFVGIILVFNSTTKS